MEDKHRTVCRECDPAGNAVFCLLSPEQQAVVDDALGGSNVCLLGSAGTGKSVILKHLVRALRDCGKVVAVVAPTGAAACQVGGQTIHAFGSIPPTDDDNKVLVRAALKRGSLVWKSTNVLVIDEISMVTPKLFDVINAVAFQAKTGREYPQGPTVVPVKPLGGLQLIVCGDFYQLPPVKSDAFCFESPIWKKCLFHVHILTQIYRQQDQSFQKLLLQIRNGNITSDVRRAMMRLRRPLPVEGDIKPTVIKCYNKGVDEYNEAELHKLEGEEREYLLVAWGVTPPVKHGHVMENLRLRVGAQVMATANIAGYDIFNGSRGVVVGFQDGAPKVQFLNGESHLMMPHTWSFFNGSGSIVGTWRQIPLRLAWAITVHRAQGASIDYAVVELGGAFAYHQTYVALSRARTMDKLQVINWSEGNCKPHPKVVAFMHKYEKPAKAQSTQEHIH